MSNNIIDEITDHGFVEALDTYEKAINWKSQQKKKAEDKANLLHLDSWVQDDLHAVINSRDPPHITGEELVKLMRWKLLRGKWRPRLVQLAKSNKSTTVEEASKEAFTLVKKNKIEAAVKKLSELKGVGPATASAILATAVPSKCAFFADEVAEVFLNGKLNYTLDEYLRLNKAILDLSERINKEKGLDLTVHQVELAIWAYKILSDNDVTFKMEAKRKNTVEPEGDGASKKPKNLRSSQGDRSKKPKS